MTTSTTTTPVAAPVTVPSTPQPVVTPPEPEEVSIPAPRRPKTIDFNPKHNFLKDGSIIVAKTDVFPTPDKYGFDDSNIDPYNGLGGESVFFCAGSSMLVLEQAQFYVNGKATIRIKVLCNEKVGWIPVFEMSRAKEWDWLIPMKQTKKIKEAFDELFSVAASS